MQRQAALYITSDAGRAELDTFAAEPIDAKNELKLIARLRKKHDAETTSALLEAAIARQKATAQEKYSRAAEMFFTRDALEQSSGEAIARYRAARFTDLLGKESKVADFCCGIGGDTIGLLDDHHVRGYDLDEVRLILARANAAVYKQESRLETTLADARLTESDTTRQAFIDSDIVAAFFDPGRRDANGKRIYDPEQYHPPLSTIAHWQSKLKALAVKVSPGIDYGRLDHIEALKSGYEVEIISTAGEVKEAVLWCGDFKQKASRKATILSSKSGAQKMQYDDADGVPSLAVAPPAAYIHEPDGAIIRAGLIELLGDPLQALKIDPDIAYLTGDRPAVGDLIDAVRSYEIIEHMPFVVKKLKERLVKLGCNRVTVKKRGSPLTPEELIKALALKAPKSAKDACELTVILTRLQGVHSAIICRPAKI